jgi:hypothetical protein
MDPWYWKICVFSHGILVIKDYKRLVVLHYMMIVLVMNEGTTHGGRAMIDLLGGIWPRA